MNWHADHARWRDTYWWWTEKDWEEGMALLAEQRATLPKDADVRRVLRMGRGTDGIENAWICLRWRVPGSPWQDTQGFDLSHICPPFCD